MNDTLLCTILLPIGFFEIDPLFWPINWLGRNKPAWADIDDGVDWVSCCGGKWMSSSDGERSWLRHGVAATRNGAGSWNLMVAARKSGLCGKKIWALRPWLGTAEVRP